MKGFRQNQSNATAFHEDNDRPRRDKGLAERKRVERAKKRAFEAKYGEKPTRSRSKGGMLLNAGMRYKSPVTSFASGVIGVVFAVLLFVNVFLKMNGFDEGRTLDDLLDYLGRQDWNINLKSFVTVWAQFRFNVPDITADWGWFNFFRDFLNYSVINVFQSISSLIGALSFLGNAALQTIQFFFAVVGWLLGFEFMPPIS